MKITNRKTLIASAIALTFGFNSMAMADDHTGQFDVTAEVIGVCSLTTGGNLEFGSYNPVTGDAVDGSTTILVTCSNGMNDVEVGLAYGGEMEGSGEPVLSYGLYRDEARSNIWSNTPGEDRAPVEANGSEQELTVYGRIAADQTDVPVDSYSETVTATVFW